MKKIPSVPFIIFPLCICIAPTSAQPISAPQQEQPVFSPQQRPISAPLQGQPVYSPQQQPISAPLQGQPVYSPQQQPVAAGAIPPNIYGSVQISETITPTELDKSAIMQFEIKPTRTDGNRAIVSLDAVEPLGGSLGVSPSAIDFQLHELSGVNDGFVKALEVANRAKQQGLSGIEKVVYLTPRGPDGNFHRFTLKIGTNGEPRIVVSERTYALSLPQHNSLGYSVPEIQAFKKLLDRLPEAQEKLVQGAQLR